jgi:pyocin large subunit-like protein
VARILYIRIDVAREEIGPKTRPHNDEDGTGSHVRKKPAIAGDAVDEHLRPVAADIGRKGPVSKYAKSGVASDYVANNANRNNYKHRKRQKHVIYIAGAIFERINDRYYVVNIVAQRY